MVSKEEFGSSSNQPDNNRPHVTTPAQDLHLQHLHLRDQLRPEESGTKVLHLYFCCVYIEAVTGRFGIKDRNAKRQIKLAEEGGM